MPALPSSPDAIARRAALPARLGAGAKAESSKRKAETTSQIAMALLVLRRSSSRLSDFRFELSALLLKLIDRDRAADIMRVPPERARRNESLMRTNRNMPNGLIRDGLAADVRADIIVGVVAVSCAP